MENFKELLNLSFIFILISSRRSAFEESIVTIHFLFPVLYDTKSTKSSNTFSSLKIRKVFKAFFLPKLFF